MPIAKVADRANVNGNAAVTTVDLVLTGLTVDNHLIIRTAADNSGGGGAARTVTVTNQSGTPIDTATDQLFQQNNDPGAASAGTTVNVVVAKITATSGTVRLTYSGSVVQAAQAEEWSGIDLTTPVVGTPVGANGTASTNLASVTDASVATNNVAYAAVAIEGPNGDVLVPDADTTNGLWTALTKRGTTNATADTNQTIVGAYKLVTGTGAQTFNPTNSVARDSAGLILELALATIPTRSGTAAQTLAGFSQTAAGTTTPPSFTGTASQSLPAFSQDASGVAAGPTSSGTASQTIPAFGQDATGSTTVPTYTASVAQTVPGFTQDASGTHQPPSFTGSVTQTLAGFSQTAAGSTAPPASTGTAAQSLPGFTQDATGATLAPTYSGAASQSLPAMTQTGTGQVFAPIYSGELVQILPGFTQSAAGLFTAPGVSSGTATQVLPSFDQYATAQFTTPVYVGEIGQTLPGLSQDAEGGEPSSDPGPFSQQLQHRRYGAVLTNHPTATLTPRHSAALRRRFLLTDLRRTP